MKTASRLTALALAAAGCATVAPPQLIEAREAYTTSSTGLAARLAPSDLYDAKKNIDLANIEFERNGDTLVCRDYAYIAFRKVELADVRARTDRDRMTIAEAAKAGVVVRDTQVARTEAALANSREQLKDERRDNDASTSELMAANHAQGRELQNTTAQLREERRDNNATTSALQATNTAQGQELEKSGAQLTAERRDNSVVTSELRAANTAQGKELEQTTAQLGVEKLARIAAEAKLAGAMKDLAAIAAIKEEPRGVVITLSGSVLFASGTFGLLNTAKTKLDQVAEALKAQDSERRMLVEGHTDSQGSEATNAALSLNRANAVRDYLVSRGVDGNRITAVGRGSSAPLADNKTAENRANNRRVEIIISPTPLSAR